MRADDFTEIPRSSFEAIVSTGLLTEVLLALIVDPSNAVDIEEAIVDRGRDAVIINTGNLGESEYRAPIYPSDFASLGSDAFDQMKITIAQWCNSTSGDAVQIVDAIARWNRNFALYAVVATAQKSLSYGTPPEVFVRVINAVLRLAQRRGGWQEVQQATEKAWDFTLSPNVGNWASAVSSAAANIGDAAILQADTAPGALAAAVRSIGRADALSRGYSWKRGVDALRPLLSESSLLVPFVQD